ncbi:MAG TPA: aminotransferase class I/II-fold pyridoxal phosphate-dependent enzyme [Actinoplanes sp.]|nr:aminotransferase class I/II-fold pyridoxal phosphate-dependent enzyme [Actinoplanes sp.]
MGDPQPLDPDTAQARLWGEAILGEVVQHLAGVAASRAANPVPAEQRSSIVREFIAPPPESPADFTTVLEQLTRAAADSLDTTAPGLLGGFVGGGLYASALAAFHTAALNRFGSLAFAAPGFTAIEEGVLRWIATGVLGLPSGSSGILTTGGSAANLSALIAARHHRLGEDFTGGTLYVSEFAHHSVAKAARVAGLPASAVRTVPGDADLRMDVAAAARMIADDRAAGRRPFLLVGTAGHTDTGTVDPLGDLADLAGREDLWFHADAAYGGFFRLTVRGQARLTGIERADSVTIDPHKSLFLPFGTGALVLRDPAILAAAHGLTGPYLRDVGAEEGLPDYAELGLELSREPRGTMLWLPLQLHGVAAFRSALDEKLDLAEHANRRLAGLSGIETPWRPDLSTAVFRARDDAATSRILDHVNADGRIYLTSTTIRGYRIIRLAILSHRTRAADVDHALDLVAEASV